MKKIVYIDMDGVIVDFDSGIHTLSETEKKEFHGKYAQYPGIFSRMKPIDNALDSVRTLMNHFDVYILSSPGWGNDTSWSDKYNWINTYLPEMKKRLILSSQKHLNIGDYIIDDRLINGVDKFTGEHIHFGKEDFLKWENVVQYLISQK